MKRMVWLLLLATLSLGGAVLGQQPEPPPEPPPDAPAAAPEPLPRIVGQARSQEELEAWNTIERTSDLAEKVRLGRQFYETYPDSGLTAYVHYSLATAYRQADQNEPFIVEAEQALSELPALPEISSYLAFLYAETGKGERAEQLARQTLEGLDGLSRPQNVAAADWARVGYRSRGDAHYALGRVELSRAMSLKDEAAALAALEKAAEHFREALRQDPRNPYASFRLGSVYQNLNQPEQAIDAYARTAALGGVIEPYARKNLQQVYQFVHQDLDGLEETVLRQKAVIDEEMTRRQEELRRLETAPAGTAPGETETPPKPPGGSFGFETQAGVRLPSTSP